MKCFIAFFCKADNFIVLNLADLQYVFCFSAPPVVAIPAVLAGLDLRAGPHHPHSHPPVLHQAGHRRQGGRKETFDRKGIYQNRFLSPFLSLSLSPWISVLAPIILIANPLSYTKLSLSLSYIHTHSHSLYLGTMVRLLYPGVCRVLGVRVRSPRHHIHNPCRHSTPRR